MTANRHYALRFVSILSTIIMLALPLVAQVDQVAISGTVTDSSGAAVQGAKIELLSTATGLHRETTTNTTGIYHLPALQIGKYKITVSKEGFKSVEFPNVELSVGQPRTIDVRLEVGTISTMVQVTATVEPLNRSSAEVGGLIETEQIKQIPISGRNWASLMLLTPGAINYGDGAQRAIRFSGYSLDDSNFTFDGVDTSGVQEQTQKADTRLNIALDAISEFRVSTGVYTAESGAAGGAQINVVSKTGSNQYHGSTFYAVRNDALDARSPFDDPTTGLPPFTLHQFGGSFGGAIKKDKAFFFANYEGLRQNLGRTFINFAPNAAFRAQALAKSPTLKPILDAYPAGGTPVDDVTNQFTKVASDTIREDAGMFRFDYLFSDRTSMYAQHSFSPSTINEWKFGFNRANFHNFSIGTAPLDVSIEGFDDVSGTSLYLVIHSARRTFQRCLIRSWRSWIRRTSSSARKRLTAIVRISLTKIGIS